MNEALFTRIGKILVYACNMALERDYEYAVGWDNDKQSLLVRVQKRIKEDTAVVAELEHNIPELMEIPLENVSDTLEIMFTELETQLRAQGY